MREKPSSSGIPMSLIITTVFYVSLYFTFADCFVASEPEPLPLVA